MSTGRQFQGGRGGVVLMGGYVLDRADISNFLTLYSGFFDIRCPFLWMMNQYRKA